MKKLFIIGLLLILGSAVAFAQTPITMGSGNTTITGCDFVVYDNGGVNNNYAGNHDEFLTIYSNDPAHNAVQVELVMTDFNVHNSDSLFIYDGTSTAAPLLVVFNDSTAALVTSPTIAYSATISNASGALTVRFKSDGAGEGTGFILNVRCVAPCQRVNVRLDPVLSSHYPHQDTDGYFYIDLCPTDTLHLVAYGEYPDNNYSYTQTDATSTFSWDLGIAAFDSVGMTTLDYYFTPGRGYDVSVNLTDSAGCPSYIPQIFRIRTSENPIRRLAQLPDVCTGQNIGFTTGYDYLSTVQVDSVGSEQLTSLRVTDTIFLPDGQDCGSGCAYVSPVTFTSFSPTATITSANDILYVRLAIEHSFVGDIWIGLECPNQQFVSLMRYGGTGTSGCVNSIPLTEHGWIGSGSTGSYFGNCYDNDSYSHPCDVAYNPMGTCWNYCWSNTTNQGYQYSAGGYVYSNSNHINGSYLDSTNVAQMSNVFHPDGSFTNLIGCPLNGTWSIKVVDGWGIDNGYVCGWELALDPSLLPQDWSYNIGVDSTYIVGPGAQGNFVVPDTSGNLHYDIYVVDDLGCVYDTNTTVSVTQSPIPNLGDDFFICQNDMITLDANYEAPNTNYLWNTGDETKDILVLSQGSYSVKVATSNDDGTLTCYGSDTINVGVYASPHFDYEASEIEGCAPLTVRFDNRTTPEDATYLWYILYSDGTMAFSSNLRSPAFKIEEPDVYSVYLRCTTADGCVDSLIKWAYITVNAQPIAEFSANPEISMMSENDGQVVFTNYLDSTIVNNGGTFYWNFDDGEVDSTALSPTHTFAQWGDYDVTLHVETEAGCSSEITHTVVLEQDLIFPNVITPNGDNLNDIFAIENLNTNVNAEDPDGYRTNTLYIYDRWGKKVYEAHNYDTFANNGSIEKGTQVFDGTGLSDGVYYFSFYYKGKAKTINYNGSLTIVR